LGGRSGCSSIPRMSWASSVPSVAKPKKLWEGLGQGLSLGLGSCRSMEWRSWAEMPREGHHFGASKVFWGWEGVGRWMHESSSGWWWSARSS
jgi:hypothetical protein